MQIIIHTFLELKSTDHRKLPKVLLGCIIWRDHVKSKFVEF